MSEAAVSRSSAHVWTSDDAGELPPLFHVGLQPINVLVFVLMSHTSSFAEDGGSITIRGGSSHYLESTRVVVVSSPSGFIERRIASAVRDRPAIALRDRKTVAQQRTITPS